MREPQRHRGNASSDIMLILVFCNLLFVFSYSRKNSLIRSLQIPVFILFASILLCSGNLLAQKPVKKHIEIPLKNFEISHIPFEFDSVLLEENLTADYYIGKSITEIKGCVYLNPGTELEKANPKLPLALRYYNDIFKYAYISRFGIFFIDKIVNKDISKYYQPFYMKQYEVTNAEYREFVYWVRDSIARRLIGDEYPDEFLFPTYDSEGTVNDLYLWNLNWDKKFSYDDEYYKPFLTSMYLPEHERYYRRKEFDTRKFNYVFYSFDKTALNEYRNSNPGVKVDTTKFIIKEVINIYPDTLAWIEQFPLKYFDALTNMYFWHPAYDNFSVVGITFEQAKAFCHWKTSQLNKQLAKNKMEVIVDLPFEYEWEFATFNSNSNQIKDHSSFYSGVDQSMATNLKLSPWNNTYRKHGNQRNDLLSTDSTHVLIRALLYNNIPLKIMADSIFLKHYQINLMGFSYSKKEVKRKKTYLMNFIDPVHKTLVKNNVIYGLNSNLSEWINETHTGTRGDIAGQKRNSFFILESGVSMYKEFHSEWKKDSASLVKYSNKLIRGENWFDNKNTYYTFSHYKIV